MKNKDIDKGFRDLEKKHSITPPPMVWDGIEEAISVKKSRKWFFIWFSVIAIGVMLSFYAVNLVVSQYSSTTNQNNTNEAISKSENSTSNLNNTQDLSLNTSKTTELVKPIDYENTNLVPNENGPIAGVEKPISGDYDNGVGMVNPPIPKHSNVFPNPGIDQNPPDVPTNPKAPVNDDQPGSDNDVPGFGYQLVGVDFLGSRNAKTLFKHDGLSSQFTTSAMAMLKMPEPKTFPPSNAASSASANKTPQALEVRYFLEGGLTFGTFKKSFLQNDALSLLRDETENEWFSYGGYLGAGKNFNDNWYGSASINWQQQKDRFSYESETVDKLVMEQDSTKLYPVRVQTTTYTSTGDVNYNTFNGVVQIGYTTPFSKKYERIRIGAEAGVMYNVNFLANGKVAVDANNLSRVENETIYKSNLGLGYTTQLVLETPISNAVSVKFRPYYNSYFGKWNLDAYASDMRVHNYGIMLGLKVKVFQKIDRKIATF